MSASRIKRGRRCGLFPCTRAHADSWKRRGTSSAAPASRGRMMCAAYCAFSRSFEGTITSASTVQSGTLQLLCCGLAPRLRLAHGILVADDQGGLHFIAELQQAVIGIAAKHKADIAFCQRGGNVRNAFIQKPVVAQIGVRIKRDRSKKDDDWLAQCIGGFDGDIERGIIDVRAARAASSRRRRCRQDQAVRCGGPLREDRSKFAQNVHSNSKAVHTMYSHG